MTDQPHVVRASDTEAFLRVTQAAFSAPVESAKHPYRVWQINEANEEIAALRQQVETLTRERDEARGALNGELINPQAEQP